MKKLWRYLRYWLGIAQRVQYKTKRLVTTENTNDHISQSIRSLFENHNKAALGLFILSFLILSFAIIQFFVSLDTDHDSAWLQEPVVNNDLNDQLLTGTNHENSSTTWEVDTGVRQIQIDRGIVISIQEPKLLAYDEWITQSIEMLAQALNDGDTEAAITIFDTYMQTTDTVQDNFNQEDISLFGQIVNDSVRIENLTIGSPTRRDRYPTTFSLIYMVSNQEYREDRSVTMLPQDDMRKIWTMQCVACSNTPLFNIERF